MKNKEEMLNVLTMEWQALAPIAKALKIQYYQTKLIMEELIQEGKAESCNFGKRTKYRKSVQVIVPAVMVN